MRNLIYTFIILLAFVTFYACKHNNTAQKKPTHFTQTLQDSDLNFTAHVINISSDNNKNFSLIDSSQPEKNETINTFWNKKAHSIAINGGYFNADFAPTGMLKIDGKYINPTINKSLSGFVVISKHGRLELKTKKDNIKAFPNILQSGPYIIDPKGQVGINSRSGRAARRTIIAATYNHDILIIVTEPIYLDQLAQALKKHLPSIERALNLDGGPSTALRTDKLNIINLTPVRNYLFKSR